MTEPIEAIDELSTALEIRQLNIAEHENRWLLRGVVIGGVVLTLLSVFIVVLLFNASRSRDRIENTLAGATATIQQQAQDNIKLRDQIQKLGQVPVVAAPSPEVVAGQPGATGAPGPQGENGQTGPGASDAQVQAQVDVFCGGNRCQGPIGPIGPAGPKGDQGLAGVNGTDGPLGPTGPGGPAGPVGSPGADGASVQGPPGPAGVDGAPGPAGPAGPQGDPGVGGPAGPAGDIGPAGATGPQGIPGPVLPSFIQIIDGVSNTCTLINPDPVTYDCVLTVP